MTVVIDNAQDQEQDQETYEPIAPLSTRIERSRIMGEYYRDLATNYPEYDRTKRWPSPPFPPQHWVTNEHQR